MRIIRGLKNIDRKFPRPVVTIGIFDGVHLGHQKVIKTIVRRAKETGGTSIIVTFDPHPWKTVGGHLPKPLICSLEHRMDLIRRLGADVYLLLDFNKEFSGISAEDFVKDVLAGTLKAECLIVGAGFRFGRDREGGFSLLKKLSGQYGFKVRRINPVKIDNVTVSSTAIRSLIRQGKIKAVNRLLGRNFSIYGRVKKGAGRGRTLGYPTANIEPRQEIVPGYGVYAVEVKLEEKLFPAVLNVGARPTFNLKKDVPPVVEAHIFDFCRNIYGKKLEVFFIQKIRSEKKFPSREALLARIRKDEVRAKAILSKLQKTHR